MHSATPRVRITEPYDLQSDITFNYQNKRYFDDFSTNSHRYSGELVQSWKIPKTECFPRLGFKYVSEDADINAQSYDYYTVQAGLAMPLVWKIHSDIGVTYAKVKYAFNPVYKVDGKRNDEQWRFVGTLTRPLGANFHLTGYYDYTSSDSDVLLAGADPFEVRKEHLQPDADVRVLTQRSIQTAFNA